MKTLTTKAVNVVLCWNNLKNIPPKDFKSMDEMEKVEGILETLISAPELKPFKDLIGEMEELADKPDDPEFVKLKTDLNLRSKKIEDAQGDQIVSIEFESDEFNTFFQFFERWGKFWFVKLPEFMSMRKCMNETNNQPKDKKVKK